MDELPVLPATALEAFRIANDLTASADHLERVISRDVALTTRILAVANSAFMGLRRPIDSVREAVVLLGTRQVRTVASLQAVSPLFETKNEGLISGEQLWAHSLAVALWTQKIGKRLRYANLTHVYTAGLMHDMGIILLQNCLGEEYEQVILTAKESQRDLMDLEQEQLGTNHARIGATLSAKWMLNPRLTWLISHHHDETAIEDTEANILRVADWCAGTMGLGAFPWTVRGVLPEESVRALGLLPEHMEEVLADAWSIREQVTGLLTQ